MSRLPLSHSRHAPEVTPETRLFWTSGATAGLVFPRCNGCGLYLHPPMPACRRCGGRSFTHDAVSGDGEVYSYTVNWHRWNDDLEPPYVIVIVELAEQPGLRVTSNLIGVAEGDVRIGMPVRVAFVPVADLAIPVFEPR